MGKLYTCPCPYYIDLMRDRFYVFSRRRLIGEAERSLLFYECRRRTGAIAILG